MKIAHIDVQNFRKLKSCRIEFANKSTVFVGANNSGKTSAMDALTLFLKRSKRREISTTDVTLSNWKAINSIGENWIKSGEENAPDLSLNIWRQQIPVIDVWLEVDELQIHYVRHLLPALDWNGGLLGARLVFEPKNVENLYKAYLSSRLAAVRTLAARQKDKAIDSKSNLTLWPESMHDFLDRKLQEYFTVQAYVLDPSLIDEPHPQILDEIAVPLDSDPLEGLFKVDIINAQRGFSDPHGGEGVTNTDRRLSAQLRNYFDKHLDPTNQPNENDLDALDAMETARTAFDEKLMNSFGDAIRELEGLNYPGFSDPQILLSSKLDPLDGLNHESAVKFQVARDANQTDSELCLPEKFNGLGYQNLISMIFNLIRFRDEWMRVGKFGKQSDNISKPIELLHLMLIEEPEAHLHAQVQQVFIKKAFNVLRNHSSLQGDSQFKTQMVVSTHSSHIAHEVDFTGLRYFRRLPTTNESDIPSACVVNMSNTFDTGDNGIGEHKKTKKEDELANNTTAKFATRYLKSTHCDLFFADSAILVEGPAERMLVPHFIRTHYPELDKCYICLLEIGGSHAHRLRPLIETLGIPTLIITDLDSIGKDSTSKARPVKGQELRTGNETIKTWLPLKNDLDEVLSVTDEEKQSNNGVVRVAYPCEVSVSYKNDPVEAGVPEPECGIPYTFEDALALGNLSVFRAMEDTKGLMRKIVDSTNQANLDEACEAMFVALDKNARKAELALELLYCVEPSELNPPEYVAEGLDWLRNQEQHSPKYAAEQEGDK